MSVKITNRKKFISGLTFLVILCLTLFTVWLNPQLLFSPTEQTKIKAVIIPTPPNSPIPTPPPNPCNYEISFLNAPPIREGSRVINGQAVPNVPVQVWDGRNGRLIGEATTKKNGRFVMNIRPLMKGSNLLLALKHNNAIYTTTKVIGTDYTLQDFNCLLTDPSAVDLPVYRYVFETFTVLPKGVTP